MALFQRTERAESYLWHRLMWQPVSGRIEEASQLDQKPNLCQAENAYSMVFLL